MLYRFNEVSANFQQKVYPSTWMQKREMKQIKYIEERSTNYIFKHGTQIEKKPVLGVRKFDVN